MKLSRPEDSRNLSPCPFCSYGHPAMTIEAHLCPESSKPTHVCGIVICPRCGGRSGSYSLHLLATDRLISQAAADLSRHLEDTWNGFSRKTADLEDK